MHASLHGAQCWLILLFVAALACAAQQPSATQRAFPPTVAAAQRFLAKRGWGILPAQTGASRTRPATARPRAQATSASATWEPLGPMAVSTPSFGLVSGRISSIAFDPSDPTGNRIYLGTTGGGVWLSQNAGTSNGASVVFTPLTDTTAAMSSALDASISIGAVTVQPGGTGVVLAGTGDPNDALDSYYGAGILRSTDGGNTWSLIQQTTDVEQGLGIQDYTFLGEGFAGFAWSTVTPQLVVAAVSQAYEGALVDAERLGVSYEGLYYSSDSGASWHLATITDPSGSDVQGPTDAYANPHGNAATAVVWNPVRQLFFAAIRYHGYYQSADGIHWTRIATQPGSGLTTSMCPTNIGSIGSTACPIFRGALAVNPQTGDTFAWTVDASNQDQGLWQDACNMSSGACSSATPSFATQWPTTALETNDPQMGAATIRNGDYNLALAAVPSGQDTLLLAGANDLWRCSLAMGCAWRNTTNATTCMSAQVGPYQHALAWSAANPLEVFIGNDSGLWRSMDDIGETGSVCNATDATHFQNLNAGLGSLAEVESLSAIPVSPYTMMAGLGANGTAGVKSTTSATADWPQILSGEGGPVAVDPTNADNWYVNNQGGVSIHLCTQSGPCTPADFGATPVVSDADVSADGQTMTTPAPFLVDPLDATQLLVGTCRIWRGPATGGWSGSNAISPFLDGVTGQASCNRDALVRSLAALPLSGGGEVVYAGMYGSLDGGSTKAGHIFSAVFSPSSTTPPAWQDLTFNPVSNDTMGFNTYGFDLSSIAIDPHDTTGNTVYVTVEGMGNPQQAVRVLYRSTDGGAHWATLSSNLPETPASSVVVDPLDANTVYLATDAGVFSTRQIATCAAAASNCWAPFGAGLPQAPVVALSAAPLTATQNVLAAATYGRGIWQIPLWTAGTQLTTATAAPTSLIFASQADGTTSAAQSVTLTNTGSIALVPTAISVTGDFSETDNCLNATMNAGASCTAQVTFTPTQTGTRTGQLSISANVAGGQLTVALSGTGAAAGPIQISPASINFGSVQVGMTSSTLQVTVQNSSTSAEPISSVQVTAPFALASNACGSSIAAGSACQLTVDFAPTQTGASTGALTLATSSGTQAVALSGAGAAPPTDTLSPASLTFSGTILGQSSAAQVVQLTNTGGVALTSISVVASGPYQVASNCGTQLAAGSSCSLSVTFTPAAAGTQTGALTVTDILKSQTVPLTGTGLLPPAFAVSPMSLTFPSQQLGAASTPQTLTVSNTGGAPMANVGFQITGPSAASFSVGATTCGATLANSTSCTVQILFTPTTAGGSSATLTLTSSTLGVKPATVALSGSGQAPAGLNVSSVQLAFTMANLGQASAAQTVTVSNSGTAAATGLTLFTAAPFSLAQNTCGVSLAAGGSCTVAIVFTPTANGSVNSTLTISSPVFAPATVLLSGVGGLAGSVQITPGLVTFPTTGIGATSAAQTVTLTNNSPVTLLGLALSASSGFQLANNTCPASLAPGASCTTGVTFAP
ncbi:MAG: choice-of-anchor D domain-containing protein, partial [Terracidiphilus sp.]